MPQFYTLQFSGPPDIYSPTAAGTHRLGRLYLLGTLRGARVAVNGWAEKSGTMQFSGPPDNYMMQLWGASQNYRWLGSEFRKNIDGGAKGGPVPPRPLQGWPPNSLTCVRYDPAKVGKSGNYREVPIITGLQLSGSQNGIFETEQGGRRFQRSRAGPGLRPIGIS